MPSTTPDMGERQRRNRRARGLVNCREAAAILGIGYRTLQRRIAEGKMPAPVVLVDHRRETQSRLVLWTIREMAASRVQSGPTDATKAAGAPL